MVYFKTAHHPTKLLLYHSKPMNSHLYNGKINSVVKGGTLPTPYQSYMVIKFDLVSFLEELVLVPT